VHPHNLHETREKAYVPRGGAYFVVPELHIAFPAMMPMKMPAGLNHFDSDLCWCDPITEVDQSGEEVVLHRQVSWNPTWMEVETATEHDAGAPFHQLLDSV
jgi:hypothetical protein